MSAAYKPGLLPVGGMGCLRDTKIREHCPDSRMVPGFLLFNLFFHLQTVYWGAVICFDQSPGPAFCSRQSEKSYGCPLVALSSWTEGSTAVCSQVL